MRAFISYSHKDDAVLERLHTHLAVLKREGKITEWFDRDILAGDEVDAQIADHLASSDLFLALVTPDFLASNYCYEKEMQTAIDRHDVSQMRVIPIIAEPCDWKATPLQKFKALPRDGKPITEWINPNNAFLDVVTELRRLSALERETIDIRSSARNQQVEARRYRVKRDFDEIDRGDFRADAFETIKTYFEHAISEIGTIDGIRARFSAIGPGSFTCTIINRARQRGIAHLTVHSRSGREGLGDIYFSYGENSPPNTANGAFSVAADDYDLFLRATFHARMDDKEKLTPEQAAEHLWADVLEQAGISHD